MTHKYVDPGHARPCMTTFCVKAAIVPVANTVLTTNNNLVSGNFITFNAALTTSKKYHVLVPDLAFQGYCLSVVHLSVVSL